MQINNYSEYLKIISQFSSFFIKSLENEISDLTLCSIAQLQPCKKVLHFALSWLDNSDAKWFRVLHSSPCIPPTFFINEFLTCSLLHENIIAPDLIYSWGWWMISTVFKLFASNIHCFEQNISTGKLFIFHFPISNPII